MIIGYGQDDRASAFSCLEAMMDVSSPDKTCALILYDKEEIGSRGATSAVSRFFENNLAEAMDLTGDYSELKLRRTLAASQALSCDVNPAYDPSHPSIMEKANAAHMGKGLAFNKYMGARGKELSNDAGAEYIAGLRSLLDEYNVSYQFAEFGKVDQGGGGTVSHILAQYNMDVIDCGVPVLSVHAPWEVSSKADIYEAVKANKAFLMNA
jgi:aspartyl aminopeptidase